MPTPPVATRKRKRAHQYTVSYSEVQEVDSDGRLREVIVIEDTPPPPTMSPATTHTGAFSASYQPPIYSAPIRTRARAAAEAQAMSSTSASAIVAPAQKKRKREHPEEVRAPAAKKLALNGHQAHLSAQTKSWESKSGAATDDVCTGSSRCPRLRTKTPPSDSQTSKGPVSCDDKEGHYIIVPDDLIYNRCKSGLKLGESFHLSSIDRSYRSTVGPGDIWQGRRSCRHGNKQSCGNQDHSSYTKVSRRQQN